MSAEPDPLYLLLSDLRAAPVVDLDPERAACLRDLDAYVAAELDGSDADSRFPAVRPALERHADLRDLRDDLRAILRLERAGLLIDSPAAPTFDLSFAPPAAAVPRPAAAGWLTGVLRLVIGHAGLHFGPLPPGLAVQTIAVAVRDTAAPETAEALCLPGPTPGLTLRLQTGPIRDGRATLTLGLEAGGVVDTRVRASLLNEAGQLLFSGLLERERAARLDGLMPGRYVIRLTQELETIGAISLAIETEP